MVHASTETDVLSGAAEREWHRLQIRLVASYVTWKLSGPSSLLQVFHDPATPHIRGLGLGPHGCRGVLPILLLTARSLE